ncbi:MAG: AsmA-like C-terminal region-containing protein [Verrucomicrobiales bacterium]|nr:AsmA-like C-terminal region-containing protein [Verrucomicrobiales bacterium]
MDKASGNLPNVPQGTEGEISVEQAEYHSEQGFGEMMDHAPVSHTEIALSATERAAQREPAPMAGMMETMLTKPTPEVQPEPVPQPAPTPVAQPAPAPAPQPEAPTPQVREVTGTLDLSARLLAPTPLDIDPPPLADVKPLSEPVAVKAETQAEPMVEQVQPDVPSPPLSSVVEDVAQHVAEANAAQPVPHISHPVQQSAPESVAQTVVEEPVIPAETAPEPALVSVAEIPAEPEPEVMPAPRIEEESTAKVQVMPEPGMPEEPAPEVPDNNAGLSLSLDSLYNRVAEPDPTPELEPAPAIEDPVPSEEALTGEYEPESVAPEEDAPLLEAAAEELVSSDETEAEPLLLSPEPEVIEELVEPLEVEETGEEESAVDSAPEEEEEKPKAVFQQETLKPDSHITQSVMTVGDPKAGRYVKNEFFVSEGAEDPWILPAAATVGLGSNSKKRRNLFGKVNVGIWSTFTSIFFFGTLIAIGGLAIAWSMRGAIGDKIEARLAEKVEAAGYYTSYEGWDYDPVRGLVLQGVTVFENANKVIPYAKVDNIGLNTDIMTLFKTRDPLSLKKTISFRESNLILFNEGAEVASFKKLKGSLELDQNQISLENLKGQLEDTLFEIEGDVILSDNSNTISLWDTEYSSSSVATSFADSGSVLGRTSKWYQSANRSVVKAAQLAQADSIILRDHNPAEVVEDIAKESKPMFAPRTDIVIPTEVIDPVEEPPAAEPEVAEPTQEEDVVEVIRDEIEEIPMPTAPETTSSVPDKIDIRSADIVSSEPIVPSLDDDLLSSTSAGTLPSLAFLRDITQYLKIESGGALPLLTSEIAVDLSEKDLPKIKAKGRLTGESITMKETAFAGITLKNVDAPYSYDHESGVLDLPGFTVSHGPGGNLAGSARLNLADQYIDLTEVRSSLDLIGLITALDPEMAAGFQHLTFHDSPKIHVISGRVPLANPLEGTIDFAYDQWAGITYISEGKELTIKEIRGNFKLADSTLSVPGLNAKVLDGDVAAVGKLKLNDPAYPFTGNLKVRGLPMTSIAEYADIESQYMNGSMNLDYQGTVAKEFPRMGGSGFVELEDSQLYKVPVIGPIQRLLGAAIPVFGAQNDSMVAGNFVIDTGVLMTSDLQVRSDGTKVLVKGQADLTRKLTAFSAKASLDGSLGMATGLIEEHIEVEGRGNLYSPQIRLKGGALPGGFSSEGIRNMLGITDGSAEAMQAMMQEIASGSGGIGGLINGVGGVRVPASGSQPASNAQKAAGEASSILNGIKNGDTSAISSGLQGLLQKRQ